MPFVGSLDWQPIVDGFGRLLSGSGINGLLSAVGLLLTLWVLTKQRKNDADTKAAKLAAEQARKHATETAAKVTEIKDGVAAAADKAETAGKAAAAVAVVAKKGTNEIKDLLNGKGLGKAVADLTNEVREHARADVEFQTTIFDELRAVKERLPADPKAPAGGLSP